MADWFCWACIPCGTGAGLSIGALGSRWGNGGACCTFTAGWAARWYSAITGAV